MKKLCAGLVLAALSVAVGAQSLTIGGGAVAGSASASNALVALAIGSAGGVANLGVVATNEGSAQAAVSTGLVIAPIPALVSVGTATSLNTTTITTNGEVPVGAAGLAGGGGNGSSFAAVGVIYYVTTTTPGPVAPPILPSIGGPIITPLQPIPVLF